MGGGGGGVEGTLLTVPLRRLQSPLVPAGAARSGRRQTRPDPALFTSPGTGPRRGAF